MTNSPSERIVNLATYRAARAQRALPLEAGDPPQGRWSEPRRPLSSRQIAHRGRMLRCLADARRGPATAG